MKGKEEGESPRRKILVLHGDRQTGDLFKSRIASLKRKLLKPRSHNETSIGIGNSNGRSGTAGNQLASTSLEEYQIELEAPSGPFVWSLAQSPHVKDTNGATLTEEEKRENDLMRTWWIRDGNKYDGLTESLEMLHQVWTKDEGFEGILGFSRGARLGHLIASLHEASQGKLFPNLKYVILASAYGDVPMPSNFPPRGKVWNGHFEDYNEQQLFPLSIPSMHIMGVKDRLVTLEASRALLPSYVNPIVHEHEGGHHVPMRAADVRAILQFIDSFPKKSSVQRLQNHDTKEAATSKSQIDCNTSPRIPDEEHALIQTEECHSLALIFPDEFKLLSRTDGAIVDEYGEERINYVHPISYAIQLKPSHEELEEDLDRAKLWPIKDIALKVEYTTDYPDSVPRFSLHHDMNLLEFKLNQERACLNAVRETAESELGMASAMSCVYRAREFFEEGGLASTLHLDNESPDVTENADDLAVENDESEDKKGGIMLKSASKERVKLCIEEGLQIAYTILNRNATSINDSDSHGNESAGFGKGGSWKYTIGLVGKPSAGKSTFFNAATAFARQRGGDEVDEDGIAIGGATMAPHPFTTIDPNVGYCLVPAPIGSCPEEDISSNEEKNKVACTHGRDSFGRRLIPVLLKDVAGLVPGAYQGRGRGNKFLDDLTDADVLIHVLDSSGTADAEGNTVISGFNNYLKVDNHKENIGSDPMTDLDWVFNELIQWVFFNVMSRWDSVLRKGQEKLMQMFSGYKQNQSFVYDVLLATERYLYKREGRDHALDKLNEWDKGDLYRLVAAFLGARFPVALALNKSDIPSSQNFSQIILEALPLHGAHAGTQISAHKEMLFVKENIFLTLGHTMKKNTKASERSAPTTSAPPHGVWNCLQSAIKMREPVIVFPVSDMETYQPLVAMAEYAIGSPSLPNKGMIGCLCSAGGSPPTLWDNEKACYSFSQNSVVSQTLRDALIMKPGSTIEDAFLVLKGMGVLGGEFVRAEAVAFIGDKPKLVKKDDKLGKRNRILKIMTTKRREWQKKG